MKSKKRWTAGLRNILILVGITMAAVCFWTAVDRLKNGQAGEGKRQLEESIRRSAVACYASEGAYAAELSYLEEHYGLQINGDRYTVIYEAIGSNLMPDITVLDNKK